MLSCPNDLFLRDTIPRSYKITNPGSMAVQHTHTLAQCVCTHWCADPWAKAAAWKTKGRCFLLCDCTRALLFSLSVVSVSSSTPRTIAYQAPLFMDFPDQNTGMGCHFLHQRIFPTQGYNLSLLHWQADSLPISHLGSVLDGK